jgi:hypothetical protein
MTPFPRGFGDGFYCLEEGSWDYAELKAIQEQLYELAGEPGVRQCAS